MILQAELQLQSIHNIIVTGLPAGVVWSLLALLNVMTATCDIIYCQAQGPDLH